MRRATERQRARNRRRSVKVAAKRVKRERRLRGIRVKRLLGSTAVVRAPQQFLLEEQWSHRDVVQFLEGLRWQLHAGHRRILVDFSKTKMIYPGGGLLLYSEIKRITWLYRDVKFRCRESRSDRVNQVLQHLDVFRMLGHNSRVRPQRADVVSWRHAYADEVDCSGAGKVIEAYASLTKPVVQLLFKAASEAVTNAIMHAYISPRRDGLPDVNRKSWWMFCREDEDRFYMTVCDLGVGIPRTLSLNSSYELIGKIVSGISLGRRPNDAQMILGAMEYARTRTRRPQQGKGLMDLRRIVDENEGGKLHVFSNRGCVTYTAREGYRMIRYRRSIKGTLIVWSVPLKQASAT